MKKITFQNQFDKEIAFSHQAPYRIKETAGFDCASCRDISTKGAFQDGEAYSDTFLEPRELDLIFYIEGSHLAETQKLKRSAFHILSNKNGLGTLFYEDDTAKKKIYAKVRSFSEKPLAANLFEIKASFTAFDPYFYEQTDSQITMAFIVNHFSFPLEFSEEGLEFSAYAQDVLVENIGESETPVLIRFYGGAKNPKFLNLTTGQQLKINGTIPDDSVLEINTAYKQKSVRLLKPDGASSNAFAMLDFTVSDFWQLVQGDNLLRYETETDVTKTSAEILFNFKTLGV